MSVPTAARAGPARSYADLRAGRGPNDQCEQFNYADSDHQHCKCYRIVLEPMAPLYVHETPSLRVEGRPQQADHRLKLELNCQSEDAKSYRRSKRDGGKGEPHDPPPMSRAGYQHADRESGSRGVSSAAPTTWMWA